MHIQIDDKNEKYIFGNARNYLFITSGDIKCEYISENKTYKITRLDGGEFKGTERINIMTYGNNRPPKDLDEIVTHELESLCGMQNIPEAVLFEEFEYYMSDDKKSIIIEPLYLEKKEVVTINLPESEEDKPVIVSMGLRKRGKRKGGVWV